MSNVKSLNITEIKSGHITPSSSTNAMQAIKRIASIDAYRGFVMLLMMGEVLSFRHVSESIPNSSFWRFLFLSQTHVPWTGCSLHDLIQPSFSFLVGVALPFSIAKRLSKGGNMRTLLKSAIKRSFILILLGIFLRSLYAEQTNFTFEDTLTQIGLGYTFLFILGFCSRRVQLITLVSILVIYWLAFALYPLPDASFNYANAGVANWNYNFHGFAAHWNKNTNFAWAFDRWFLNLFPRSKPFNFNAGGYCTLSFLPTLGTMILGLLAGNVLKSDISETNKVKRFVLTGAGLILIGLFLHFIGINPIVKKIWTPAWTIFSGGCCFLFLAFFYWVIDIKNYRKWAFIFMIIGMNSIACYVIAESLAPFIGNTLYIHLGHNFDQIFGSAYSTLVKGSLVLFIEWMILYWMYKRKIFIKI